MMVAPESSSFFVLVGNHTQPSMIVAPLMPWACQSLPSSLHQVSFLPSFLNASIPGNNYHLSLKNKSHWIKSLLDALTWCSSALTKSIDNMKVRRKTQPLGFRYSDHRYKCKRPRPGLHAALPCMTTMWANDWTKTPALGRQFDSDSQNLMVNDGMSACITNDIDNFIELPKRVDRKVKGIKCHMKATHRGTLKWHVEDDNGLVHVMMIKGAYLIPDAATRILSPQHLAQQPDGHYPKDEGTGALMTSKNIMLFWSQRRFAKTVPLNPRTNMGLTTTASGVQSFRAFCATTTAPETMQPNIFMTHIIPDEEDDDSFQPKDPVEPPSLEEDDQEKVLPESTLAPQTTIIDLGPITHVIPEDQEPTSLDPHDELLRWHYRLGHLSFDHIKQLAQSGQLPKCLLASKKPFCSACQYGKMTKHPWRVKGDNENATKTATQPGQIVSVDQLESNSLGFIAQLKGKLTQQRYK